MKAIKKLPKSINKITSSPPKAKKKGANIGVTMVISPLEKAFIPLILSYLSAGTMMPIAVLVAGD